VEPLQTRGGNPDGDFTVHLTPPSAEQWRQWVSSLGALVCGRTLFDVAEGWHGRHTLDVPVVVVTHRVPTDWVRRRGAERMATSYRSMSRQG
jgi:hypothetical protein